MEKTQRYRIRCRDGSFITGRYKMERGNTLLFEDVHILGMGFWAKSPSIEIKFAAVDWCIPEESTFELQGDPTSPTAHVRVM
jgi:hypothetical protein